MFSTSPKLHFFSDMAIIVIISTVPFFFCFSKIKIYIYLYLKPHLNQNFSVLDELFDSSTIQKISLIVYNQATSPSWFS